MESGEVQDTRTMGKQYVAGICKHNNGLLISSNSNCASIRTSQPKNDNHYITQPTNCVGIDSKTIRAIKTVPGPLDVVDALGKRMRKRIFKSRKNVTPRYFGQHDIKKKHHCNEIF